jgi:hypothetical protein
MLEMVDLLPVDHNIIAQHPLNSTLDHLQEALQRAEQLYQCDPAPDDDQEAQKAILRLLATLMGHNVALELRNVASELASLYGRVASGKFNYGHHRAVSQLVIKKAPDIDIWRAVLDLSRPVTTKILCFQLTDTKFPDDTIHQIPFTSNVLLETLKRCGFPYIELARHAPGPYEISCVLNQAYIYCTDSKEREELVALRDKLEPWQLRDIYSHGSINNLASSPQFLGEGHREYLLEVLEILRWKDTAVSVHSEGHVSPEGEPKLHTLIRVDAGDSLILHLLPYIDGPYNDDLYIDDLVLVHSVPWHMAPHLPGLFFEKRHFVSIPVSGWSWCRIVENDGAFETEGGPGRLMLIKKTLELRNTGRLWIS